MAAQTARHEYSALAVRVLVPLLTLSLVACTACSTVGQRDTTFVPSSPGILRVATSLPAPGFWNGSSPEALSGGFEYAIARDLARRFDLQLQIVDVPFERIVDGDLGGADLALAQITVTPERSKRVALSVPYLAANMGILTRSGMRVADLEACRKLRWVVEDATTEQTFLRQIVRPSTTPVVAATRDATLDALERGDADAALLDLPTALATARTSSNGLAVPGQFVTDQQLAAALPLESANLEPVNAALRNLIDSGRLHTFEVQELVPLLGRDPPSVPIVVARTVH